MIPTFYDWLIKYYINSNSPAGDLARDIARDELCPKTSYTAIKKHIIHSGGGPEVITAAEEMWKIYRQCFPETKKTPTKDFHGFTISSRLFNRFRFNDIKTLEDVLNLSMEDAARMSNIGDLTLGEISKLKKAIQADKIHKEVSNGKK